MYGLLRWIMSQIQDPGCAPVLDDCVLMSIARCSFVYLCKDHCLISLLYSRRFHSILQQVFDGCKLAKISTLLCGWHCPIHRVEPAVFREAYFCACLVVFLDLVRRVVVWVNKKLSYRRGTARRATLVNSCCFASYGSYKGFKQQM